MPAAQIANGIGMSLQMSFRHRCALCGGRASRSSGPAVAYAGVELDDDLRDEIVNG